MVRQSLALATLLWIVCVATCWGQSMGASAAYGATPTFSTSNNLTNGVCVSGQYNCWHLIGGFAVGATSNYGYSMVWNGSNQAFTFNESTGGWDYRSDMGVVYGLAVVSRDTIYGLVNDASCPTGNYRIALWRGSWQKKTFCVVSLTAAPDGTILGVAASGTAAYSSNGGINWTTIGAYSWASGSVGSSKSIALVRRTDNAIFTFINNALAQTTGVGPFVALNRNGLFAIGGVQNGNNVYYSTDNGVHWILLAGGLFTCLANGDSWNEWGCGPTQSGQNLYRFSSQSLVGTNTLSGYANCPAPICSGIIHQGSVQGYFTGTTKRFGGTVNGQSVNGGTLSQGQSGWPLNVSSTDVLYDYWTCFFDAGACGFRQNLASVFCSATDANVTNQPPVSNPLPFQILNIDPGSAMIGTNSVVITIEGTGFDGSTKVNLPAGFSSSGQGSTDTKITITVNIAFSATIGKNSITVTNAAGETSNSATFIVNGPNKMIVQQNGDVIGPTSTNPNANSRYVTYQVQNFDDTPATSIPVAEAISVTGYNCMEKDPGRTWASCNAQFKTGADGILKDEWGMYTGFTPSTCGVNIVDHWQWCGPAGSNPSAPNPGLTFGTLTGWIHTVDSSINGFTNPPTPMPSGKEIDP